MKTGLATFTRAIEFASIKHVNQRRKNGDIPYINHPIDVANILAQSGVEDYDVLSAAILHDTVEDTDTTPEELQKQFGNKIKTIVMECSDDKGLSKIERKREQIRHVKEASNDAKLVKIADKLSNNIDLLKKPPPKWSEERVKGYFTWSYAVCRNMKGINEILDKKMDEFFEKVGVINFNSEELEKKLEEYYQILPKD